MTAEQKAAAKAKRAEITALVQQAADLAKLDLLNHPTLGNRKCTGTTTDKTTGEVRPCSRWAIKGGFVCTFHGGSLPQVRAKAMERLRAMVDPTITRLEQLRDQSMHLPTALGASAHIMNRALGKAGDAEPIKKRPQVINVGFVLGGIPAAVQARITAPEVIEGETDQVEDDTDPTDG